MTQAQSENLFDDDIELLSVKTGYGFDLFCENFGLESIDETACESYKDEKDLLVLTAGILDGDIIGMSIVQNGEIVSKITVRSDDCPKDIYEDMPEEWSNCECFEKLFGVSEKALKESIEEDMLDTLINWSGLLKMNFARPYYSVEEDEGENAKKFSISRKDVTGNAKVVDIKDFTRILTDYLKF